MVESFSEREASQPAVEMSFLRSSLGDSRVMRQCHNMRHARTEVCAEG